MNLWQITVLSIFDMVLIYICIAKMIDLKNVDKYLKFIFIFIGGILGGLASYYIDNSSISVILSNVIMFTMVALLVRNKKLKIWDTLTLYVISVYVAILLQFISILFMNFIIGSISYEFYYGIISQVITLILDLIIINILPMETLFPFIESKNYLFKMIIGTVYILYLIIVLIWHKGVDDFTTSSVSIIIVVLFSVTIYTIIFRHGLMNQVHEQKLEVLETYLPIIEDVMSEFKAKQHDYHNHIQSLSAMVENPVLYTGEDRRKYIDTLIGEDIWTHLIKLDDKILMALFYSKYNEADEKDVTLSFDIKNYFIESIYSDFELVEMYGILIDNAIEAAVETEEKWIKIEFSKEEEYYLFNIRNSSLSVEPSQILHMFDKGYTTKGGSDRGTGLYKLKEFLGKKRGTITAHYDTLEKSMEIDVKHF